MTRKKVTETLLKLFVPFELKDTLQRLAAARNVSLSSLVRLILTEYTKSKG
jgi:hypothetical protein